MAEEFIKPSHKPIRDYYAALEALRGQGGKRETELRAAFQELLSKLARQRGWTFMPERPIIRDGRRVVPDGTLLDEGVPLGHWEAKDGDDKLAIRRWGEVSTEFHQASTVAAEAIFNTGRDRLCGHRF